MKKSVLIFLVLLFCLSLCGCCLQHEWQDATCTEPKTCAKCGKTQGEPFGHSWIEATCTEPKTCSVCGITEGEALGHDWQEATPSAPVTCATCGEQIYKAVDEDGKINVTAKSFINMYNMLIEGGDSNFIPQSDKLLIDNYCDIMISIPCMRSTNTFSVSIEGNNGSDLRNEDFIPDELFIYTSGPYSLLEEQGDVDSLKEIAAAMLYITSPDINSADEAYNCLEEIQAADMQDGEFYWVQYGGMEYAYRVAYMEGNSKDACWLSFSLRNANG